VPIGTVRLKNTQKQKKSLFRFVWISVVFFSNCATQSRPKKIANSESRLRNGGKILPESTFQAPGTKFTAPAVKTGEENKILHFLLKKSRHSAAARAKRPRRRHFFRPKKSKARKCRSQPTNYEYTAQKGVTGGFGSAGFEAKTVLFVKFFDNWDF
jgi:hypothetical protein